MSQIISVSRRTDIPAYYSEWFIKRVRAGFCFVPNPYNPKQVTRVSLRAKDVKCFVFWTRNPRPLIPHLDELDRNGYKYYFLYTINGYPKEIEPSSPSVDESISTFKELSERIGKENVIWRYDPVVLSSITDEFWHRDNFEKQAASLQGFTDRCIISVIDDYAKTVRRMEKETPAYFSTKDVKFELDEYSSLLLFLAECAKLHEIEIRACCEEDDLSRYGIKPSSCIDPEIVKSLTGEHVKVARDKNQRKLCRCAKSKDIGVNNTCLRGCKYCYATSSDELAKANHAMHDPEFNSLLQNFDE